MFLRRPRVSVGVTLVWPTVAVLGFLAMTGLIVALGASSTARYEFERNRVPQQQRSAADRGAGTHPGGSRRAGEVSTPGGAAESESRLRPEAGGVAVRPAVTPAAVGPSATGWWLVGEPEDGTSLRAVAGPFHERVDADWAALAGGLRAVAVYGALRPDGALVPRTSPEERAWLSELGEQLDRLAEDWDELLSDTDELTTLVVEVAAAIVEAGLPLHDCAQRGPGGDSPAGGVCLTPDPGSRGILVSWCPHDRMSVDQARGPAADAAVQQLLNAAVADVLAQLGFEVQPLASTGCHLVTTVRR
jgi:hypothetical protein